MTSTVDFYKWMQAIQDEKFLTPEMRQKIFFDYHPGEDNYGWTKALTGRKTKFYHKGGGRSDFENRLMWYPEDGVVIMFFINNDYNLAWQIFTKIRAIMN